MKTSDIAIVGIACKYPDANNPDDLWNNVLTQRRAFRNIPKNRLSEDYFSANNIDKIYSRTAAVINNYEFDRSKFKISGKNYRTADLTHWLALDTASKAIEDSNITGIIDDVKDKIGVYVGNTLTGEFSRSNIMRLRWPYVKRKLTEKFDKLDWSKEDIADFLVDFEKDYKSSFSETEEDSLAGSLSNTIAGRICNYFDFHGGGYTLDGACCSSLLAIIDACRYIESGENLISIAGGVDLSLDPFELVGFSRTGALAKRKMLVFDKNSNGFWPGEGCGFTILADLEFAKKHNLKIYAIVKGYGVSTDGQGGLTRPSVEGQSLALQKAYNKSGYSISDVSYFEAHGTGTAVGDRVELETILSNLHKSQSELRDHYIGSVKGNFGHTKAAAGIAGFIKTVKVLENRMIPPITGCEDEHDLLKNGKLIAPKVPIPYESERTMRASVSAMGFGGINAHITLEEYSTKDSHRNIKNANFQDYELFLLEGNSKEKLCERIDKLLEYAQELSIAELIDVSLTLYKGLRNDNFRAAIISSSPKNLYNKLEKLKKYIDRGFTEKNEKGIYLNCGRKPKNKIGLLFPGQGSKCFYPNKILQNRFPNIRIPSLYPKIDDLGSEDLKIKQVSVVGTALIAKSFLHSLGINGNVAVGHSLGEISALNWAEALSDEEALKLAYRRGKLMMNNENIKGLMLVILLPKESVESLIKENKVQISAINSQSQLVVSGKEENILALKKILIDKSIPSVLLDVNHAFHSSLMKQLNGEYVRIINDTEVKLPVRKFYSSVSPESESKIEDIKENLLRQLSEPVMFLDAIEAADKEVDLWIEVGGDRTLESITKNITKKPITSMTFNGNTFEGILNTVGLLWCTKNKINLNTIFKDRYHKPFVWEPSFLSNPCESGDKSLVTGDNNVVIDKVNIDDGNDLMMAFKVMISEKLELRVDDIDESFKLLDDLHMNSLEVGKFVTNFADKYKINLTGVPTEYANASIKEIVEILQFNTDNENLVHHDDLLGIEPWTHLFSINYKEEPIETWESKKPLLELANTNWKWIGDSSESIDRLKINSVSKSSEGVLVNLQNSTEKNIVKRLMELIHELNENSTINQIIILQSNTKANSFLKSIHLENPILNVLIITSNNAIDSSLINLELSQNVVGFKEILYNNSKRFRPYFSPVFENTTTGSIPLNSEDVLLVTGGGKGITSECALHLGKKYGVKLVIIGRSDVDTNKDLFNNLNRFSEENISYTYYSVDISNKDKVVNFIKEVYENEGTITGLIHGAGINKPISYKNLTDEIINSTLEPKLFGFRNLLASMDVENLKLLISFGSIIGESGMIGNSDYALANEWLKHDVLQFSEQYPDCNCLNAEWSVWSGAGMGEKLGVLDNLVKSGIQPIGLDKGIEIFMNWIEEFPTDKNIIISGRYGLNNTLLTEKKDSPIYRFIDDVKLIYPNIELIADFELSEHTDLYLHGHKISDEYIFPGVMGLEAFEQAFRTLCPEIECFSFEDMNFDSPIIMKNNEKIKIRIILCRLSTTNFKVALRSSITNYTTDHFYGKIIVSNLNVQSKLSKIDIEKFNKPSFDVGEEIYQNLLFHSGIFKVIDEYLHLSPYQCIVKAKKVKMPYFGNFVSETILSSLEPAIRDAALHCVQACDPEFAILPTKIKKISSVSNKNFTDYFIIEADEILKKGNIYIYNILIKNEHNEVLEYWDEVTFKVLDNQKESKLSKELLNIIIQRRTDEMTGHSTHVNLYSNGTDNINILRRYDRKPLMKNGFISRSNLDGLSIQVSSNVKLGCDIEKVILHEENKWQNLLGVDKFNLAQYVSKSTGENLSLSATRVWGILESLKKADISLFHKILFEKEFTPNYHQYKISDNVSIISYSYNSKEINDTVVYTLLLVKNKQEVEVNEKV